MRRVVFMVAGLLLLCGCAGLADTDKDDDGPRPTARSEVDGVEVWDLTGPPTAQAFGIEDDSVVGIYETQKPRTVRFEFPGGSELTIDATLVTLERFGGDVPRFSVGIRSAQLEPDDLVATFRDVLEQFGVSTDPVDQFAAEVRAAPDDQSERIIIGSDSVTLGDLQINAEAGIAPLAGAGRVIVGGFWKQD